MNSKSTRDIIALLCFYVYLAILILKKITHVAFLTKKKVKTDLNAADSDGKTPMELCRK